jgi:D-hexose-6-phosphate mutarotase
MYKFPLTLEQVNCLTNERANERVRLDAQTSTKRDQQGNVYPTQAEALEARRKYYCKAESKKLLEQALKVVREYSARKTTTEPEKARMRENLHPYFTVHEQAKAEVDAMREAALENALNHAR